jgi:hypothetical protein
MLNHSPNAMRVHSDLEFVHSEISGIHRYWHGLKSEWPIPCRRDIDPVSAPRSLLPYMALAEIVEDEDAVVQPRRYRWRLVGTHITAALGRDSTGGIVDEMYTKSEQRFFSEALDRTIGKQKPLRLTGSSEFAGKAWLEFEAVYLPLCQPCGAVNMILLGTIFS